MQKIQPGHEVLSLLGMAQKNQALKNQINRRNLVISLIGAFFIILAVSLVLNLSTQALSRPSRSVAVVADLNEPAAFEPSQLVSQEITRGYFKLGQ